jgi:hypothetical protein
MGTRAGRKVNTGVPILLPLAEKDELIFAAKVLPHTKSEALRAGLRRKPDSVPMIADSR